MPDLKRADEGMDRDTPQDKQVDAPDTTPVQRLRLLSYNIQTGITTSQYRDYVTHSWKHVLPHTQRSDNLNRIATLASDYDLVGLQEVDAGSLRSGFINQTEYLANRAHFPHWHDQTNRRIGKIARHSTGLLSRWAPTEIREHKLPGMIPGRGVLLVRFGEGDDALVLLIMHLSLGKRTRMRQFGYVSELVNAHRNVILMGDMNCRSESSEMNFLINKTLMCEPAHGLHTFPSWRPHRNIDHILVTPTLQVEDVQVLNYAFSDHLPISMTVKLPTTLKLPS